MRRISVVGCSGSGKTTLARALAARMACEHVELDALFHQPGWVPLPRDAFRARLGERLAAPSWVVDGNYGTHVQDLVWAAADTVVWLDLPRTAVLARVVRRTLRRVVTGEELWNGNRERWANVFDPRPAQNVILWSWTRHEGLRRRYEHAAADPRNGHLRFVRLRTPEAVEAFARER